MRLSETKDFINQSREGSTNIMFVLVPLLPESQEGEVEGEVDTCRFNECVLERNTELEEATVFIARGKHACCLSLRDRFPLPSTSLCKYN